MNDTLARSALQSIADIATSALQVNRRAGAREVSPVNEFATLPGYLFVGF